MEKITCFKAYDVRGRIPDQLNEDIARRIGRAFAEVVKPSKVVVGHDIRLTSESIKAALTQGLIEQGVDVYDIGLCGTEEIYFATSHAGMDGGIAVTASHNPKDYNGMKFVREESKPISGDTGLFDIEGPGITSIGYFHGPLQQFDHPVHIRERVFERAIHDAEKI